jgi:hypothetical protein
MKTNMYTHFILLALIALVYNAYGTSIDSNNGDNYNLRHGRVDNPVVGPTYDCPLRAFTIEMAGYIAPAPWKANWTALSQSAFQMNQCNGISQSAYEPSSSAKPFKTAPEMPKDACQHTIFVHDFKGSDLFDGSFEKPMKTIQGALSLTRSLRPLHGSDSTLCITIRGGTYYLGTNATTSSSQIGAIALTSNDSNTVIENYQDEKVILSGGTLLQLQWSVHAKTAVGGTIMKAQVPSSVNLDHFNELYIDGRRAIVAKYPNGDPSTQGLYAHDSGFSHGAESWVPPIHNPSVEIHVQEPSRNGTVFTNYQLGEGGGASVFNPPSNFWSTASPPAGHNYVVPRGLIVK